MILVYLTGLPTRELDVFYGLLCDRLKSYFGVVCLREVFDYSTVATDLHVDKHVMFLGSPRPSEFKHLPQWLVELIYYNSQWTEEWLNESTPKSPYLGEKSRIILGSLSSIETKILLYDTLSILDLLRLMQNMPKTLFVVYMPTYEYLRSSIEGDVTGMLRRKVLLMAKFVDLYGLNVEDTYRDFERRLLMVYSFVKKQLDVCIGQKNLYYIDAPIGVTENKAEDYLKAVIERVLELF